MAHNPSIASGIGTLLRDHRKRQSRSQEDVAWSCGITQSRLSEFERGVAAPSVTVFARLARSLGITPQEYPERYRTLLEASLQ